MDNFVSSSPNRSYDFETKEQRIKAHLKTVVSDEVYNKWIENFVFEKIDSKKILIGTSERIQQKLQRNRMDSYLLRCGLCEKT